MPEVEKLSKAAVLNALGQRRHVAKRGNLGSFNCFVCGNCIHAGKTHQGTRHGAFILTWSGPSTLVHISESFWFGGATAVITWSPDELHSTIWGGLQPCNLDRITGK